MKMLRGGVRAAAAASAFLLLLVAAEADPAATGGSAGGDGEAGIRRQPYKPPEVSGLHWAETFDGDVWSRWTPAGGEKYTGRWRVEAREEEALIGDLGLVMPEAARHYGLSADVPPVRLEEGGPALLVQIEVRHQKTLDCGGSYIKLFRRGADNSTNDPAAFREETPYSIMFGPDVCGATNKVHFILRHQSPLTAAWEEKHLSQPPEVPRDRRTHLYGLMIRPDNYFEVQVDGESKASGSLLDAMEPSVNPPKQVDDPTDTQPADWIDDIMIDDPEAKRPDDWGDESEPAGFPDPSARMPDGWNVDAPLKIPDPHASKPDDWDDKEDGEWEPLYVDNPACIVGCGKWKPPMISNPKYVGKWEPPLIDNPDYKGKWAPRKIDNPAYFFDAHPALFSSFDAVGFDLWTMQGGIMFDNIVIVLGNVRLAEEFANQSWRIRKGIEELQDPPTEKPGNRKYPEWLDFSSTFKWLDEHPAVAAIFAWSVLLFVVYKLVLPDLCPKRFKRAPSGSGNSDGSTAGEGCQKDANDKKVD